LIFLTSKKKVYIFFFTYIVFLRMNSKQDFGYRSLYNKFSKVMEAILLFSSLILDFQILFYFSCMLIFFFCKGWLSFL
jgi:hypothetical protein